MEAVAPHALVVERPRQGIAVGVRRVAAVKRGVEAGDLRHLRIDLLRQPDRREVVRLVQRRQRRELGEPRQHAGIDPHRPVEVRPPVHDTVADRPELEAAEARQPAPELARGGGKVGQLPRRIAAVDQRRAISADGLQPRMHADAVDLPLHPPLQPLAVDGEDLELEARGAGVDDEDRLHQAAGTAIFARSALA